MKIIINPSHGGSDIGNTSNNVKEKDLNLMISKYLASVLTSKNINNVLIRTSDETLSSDKRIEKILSNINDDDLVLTIRLNDNQTNGVEIIYPLRSNSKLAESIASSLENKNIRVNKYYQRRLPTNLAQDYDTIIRGINPYNGIIIEYGTINNVNDINNNYKTISNAIADVFALSSSYVVVKGDSLYSIAKKFNTSIDELKTLNNLTSNVLQIGQKLKIPSASEKNSSDDNNYYIVQKGDTLYSIARRFNTTVNNIKQINNISSNLLRVGMKLLIPENYIIYTVVKGDNLYSIAKKFNTGVSTIKELNNLTSNIISINQKLKIPR